MILWLETLDLCSLSSLHVVHFCRLSLLEGVAELITLQRQALLAF